MIIKIRRDSETLEEFEVLLEDNTLLEVLEHIKSTKDATLSYDHSCRSGVCGSCAVRVNSKEQLACEYKLKDGDIVEPLKNIKIIRDLVVDNDDAQRFNQKSNAWLESYIQTDVSKEDEKQNELQSDCILCTSCYSACPVYEVNKEFLGPFALTRVWKYVADKREDDIKQKIELIQNNGIWDCTLCGECTIACPQGISPKDDIMMLRSKSGVMGYMDPNFSTMSFGGFDPNGGF